MARIWLSVAGQLFGFIVAIFTIGVAGFLLYHDKQLGGFTALIGGLGTLVGTFIYRRRAAKGQQIQQRS